MKRVAKYKRGQVVYNREWERYGRLTRRHLHPFSDDYKWEVQDTLQVWFESDLRPLTKTERGGK